MTPSDAVSARRMHVALATVYIVAIVLIEVGLFLRLTHLAFLLLLDNGFTFAVMLGLVVTLIYGTRAGNDSFNIDPWAARAIMWCAVAALAMTALNGIRLFTLLMGDSQELPPDWCTHWCADWTPTHPIGQNGLEALLRQHMHESEWVVVLLMLLFFILIAGVHIVTIVYCARAAHSYFTMGHTGPMIRPYNQPSGGGNTTFAFDTYEAPTGRASVEVMLPVHKVNNNNNNNNNNTGTINNQNGMGSTATAASATGATAITMGDSSPWKHAAGRVVTSRPGLSAPMGITGARPNTSSNSRLAHGSAWSQGNTAAAAATNNSSTVPSVQTRGRSSGGSAGGGH